MNSNIPKIPGFYYANGDVCMYADSKQISEDEYELQHDLWYRAKDGALYLVKKGFRHDGASKGILKHFGKFTNAAILHDALCRSRIVSIVKANWLFFESMGVLGVAAWRRYVDYSGVMLFCWATYLGHTRTSIETNKKFIETGE